MSILDTHTEDTLAAIPRFIPQAKPEPVRKFSAWGLATAVPRAVTEAVAQVGASVAETIGAFGQVGGAYPEAFGYFPEGEARKQADQAREKLLREGVDMNNDVGESLRNAGASYRPDPQTSNLAEQTLYGFTRAAAKVVGGAVTGGPLGVAAAGLEESVSQADDLRRAGVTDPGTRAAAGLVQGAGLAAAALPAVGPTLRATAALYLAGGPGGFIAQQALTRKILTDAGFEQQGLAFDPFDPVGLAVSTLLPAGFAALGLRAQRRAGAPPRVEVPPEVADSARVAYETDVRRDGGRGVVDANVHEAALQRTEAAMARGEPVQVADVVPPLRVEPLEAFAARARIAPDAVPAEVRGNFLAFIRDAGGIDAAQKLDITGDANGVMSNPAGIFRRGGRGTDELAMLAEEAGYLRPGQGGDSGALVDMVQRAVRGERVLTLEEQGAHAAREHQLTSIQQRLKDAEARLSVLGVDPAPAHGNVAVLEAYLRENEPRLLGAALDEVRAAADESPEFDELRARAEQTAADIRDSGRTLDQWEAEIEPLSPVMRRLVAEELKPQRAAAAPADAAPARPAPPESKPATDTSAPGATTPAAAAETSAASARLAAIEQQHPGLQVMVDGMDKPLPLAEFLAAAKAEADELAADAPLMQVAAECALSNA